MRALSPCVCVCRGKGVLRRVEEVFDCWFESGSMPYAQIHYPFENADKFKCVARGCTTTASASADGRRSLVHQLPISIRAPAPRYRAGCCCCGCCCCCRLPANFIAEGLDQTRGWFYTLMVLSTALFGKPAFQNLIVNGLVLAEDGACRVASPPAGTAAAAVVAP